MTKEIRDIVIGLHEVNSVYGFGSAFRSNSYQDIDLLVIFESHNENAFAEYMTLLKMLEKLMPALGVKIDVTALTVSEASANPLRESDHLIPLYERASEHPNGR